MEIPYIEVGILFAPTIRFRLNGNYTHAGKNYQGEYQIRHQDSQYLLQHQGCEEPVSLPLQFQPENYTDNDFDLLDVTIGIHFHWERQEDQKFKGSLHIIDEDTHLTAINRLPLEEYLLSVISSEMKATSSSELLKAHAVISRSWLLAQKAKAGKTKNNYRSCYQTDTEYIRWYDREDHRNFDVCADDHCQRYQGISKAYTPTVREAIAATRGEVLIYNGEICDARFSKCCGGITEQFENTWEPVVHPYLCTIQDTDKTSGLPDLTDEETARQWILSTPPSFCNTHDTGILSEVLNDYDLETTHFFRWQETFTQEEISRLICEKTGIDFGTVTDLIPVERGTSGRLIRLKIVGSKRTLTIGKELVIRKALSLTHLYSSAFVIDKQGNSFTLHGAGWGHGVGLCQIGAAVMGAQGYNYQEILQHYFKGSKITKIYE